MALGNVFPGIGSAASAAGAGSSVAFVNAAVGAGLMNQFRSNVQHPFDRIFFLNTADLAGQSLTFFQVGVSGNYNILNGGGTTRTKTAEDTNWDQANQAQYSYLLTGMTLKFQTLQPQSFASSPDDLTTWPDLLRSLVEDSSIQIISEDNILQRQKAVHIPEGNAVSGFVGVTGTAAGPVSQPVVSNGSAWASNVFSFGSMVLWVPKSTRFNVKLTFGNSLLASSMAYKPTTPQIFAEVRFQGLKLQATV